MLKKKGYRFCITSHDLVHGPELCGEETKRLLTPVKVLHQSPLLWSSVREATK